MGQGEEQIEHVNSGGEGKLLWNRCHWIWTARLFDAVYVDRLRGRQIHQNQEVLGRRKCRQCKYVDPKICYLVKESAHAVEKVNCVLSRGPVIQLSETDGS